MLAQWLRIGSIAWLAALIGWLLLAPAYLPVGWVLAGVLVLVFAHVGVLAFEFALMYLANRHHPLHPVQPLDVAAAWLAETLIAARVFLWEQAFRSRVLVNHLPSVHGQRAVLLVHGLVCNRGFWNPWMRKLRARGIPYMAITLEPVFGAVEEGVAAIDAAVIEVTRTTGLAPLIVTHSMGGLSVRAWLRARSADDRVHHVLTIAAPHQGTALARLATSEVARRMQVASPWLTALAAAEPTSRYRRFTCFYGHCDNVVFPMHVATLPGADNRHVAHAAHIQMAYLDEVFDAAIGLLNAPPVAVDAERDHVAVKRPNRATD